MDKQKRAYLYAMSAILLWSTIASAFKITLQYIDFYQILFISSITSLICLFIVLLWQNKLNLLLQLNRKQIWKAAIRGFLNPFLYYLVLLKAYTLLKAQEAGTLNYIWPITLVLLSIPLLKQKIGWKSIIAIFISFFGIIVISTEGHLSSLEFREPLGVFLAVISSVFWALYWILNIRDKTDDVLKLFLNFLFGAAFVVFYILIFEEFNFPEFNGFAGAVYIGLFEMGLTYIFWLLALRNSANTARVSNLVFLSPFISLIIIRFFVGEKILAATITGLALIIGGILLQQFSNRNK